MNDSELIDHLGGPVELAKLLQYDRYGASRVCNWRKRGIPARVKLAHPHLFLASANSDPAAGTEGAPAVPQEVQRAA